MEIPGEQPYQQAVLHKESDFRLLYLRAGVGDEAIHIDIITFNLDDNPDFEAISYSWEIQHQWKASPVSDILRLLLWLIAQITNVTWPIRGINP